MLFALRLVGWGLMALSAQTGHIVPSVCPPTCIALRVTNAYMSLHALSNVSPATQVELLWFSPNT